MSRTRVLAAALLVGALGCESRLPTAAVTGRITYKGQPVTTGTVAFHPTDLAKPLSRGAIGPDGRYTLGTYAADDGAVPGEFIVTVHSFTPGRGVEGRDKDYEPPRPLVPTTYTQTQGTPLKATVNPSGNVIDLDLK
jgi:hypothetical protein